MKCTFESASNSILNTDWIYRKKATASVKGARSRQRDSEIVANLGEEGRRCEG